MDDRNRWSGSLNDPLQIFNLQMRTPLSQAFSVLNRIQAEQGDNRQLMEQLIPLSSALYRILRTVINFTADEYLCKDQFGFHPEYGDLCGYFRQICKDAENYLATAGIAFSYQIPDESLPCRFDEAILSRVLMNLLSNACRFSSGEKQVSVRLVLMDEQAVLTVSDNGCGMDQQVLSRAFDRFYSCDPDTGIPCGDGLGLSISRRLMQLHGGTVVLSSQPGKGTDAAVTIPLTKIPKNAQLKSSVKALSEDAFSDLYVMLSDSIDPPYCK